MHVMMDTKSQSYSTSLSRLPTVTCEAPSSDTEDQERHTQLLFKPTTKRSEHVDEKSRRRKFHQQFQELPDREMLIDYFSCALITDIILQGHLYITSEHFAFHSNMSEFVTKLIIPISSVTNVTKERTAYIIPNAIAIITKTRKHVFGTLLSRDTTHKILTHVWRGRNNQKASEILCKEEAKLDKNIKIRENDTISSMGNDDFDDKLSDDGDYTDDDSSISESRCSSRTEYSYDLKNLKLSPIPVKKGKFGKPSIAPKIETREKSSQTMEESTKNDYWSQYLKQISCNDLWLLGSIIILIVLFTSAGVLLNKISLLQHEYDSVMQEHLH